MCMYASRPFEIALFYLIAIKGPSDGSCFIVIRIVKKEDVLDILT